MILLSKKTVKNFYISAIYTSPPDSMGGNTKIMIEFVNQLRTQFKFTIFTSQPVTFFKNLVDTDCVNIIHVPYNYRLMNYRTHLKEIHYVSDFYKKYFAQSGIKEDDYFYSSSDFAPDVLPVVNLKKKYKFKWIASLFLFVPNPLENFLKEYGFPFFKYVVYFIYQRWLFKQILDNFDYCCITNDVDKAYFPVERRNDIFAFYGGVNLDQIKDAKKADLKIIKYAAVFCSRLHPQKGISQLLEIWRLVTNTIPDAKLAVIGNGEQQFVDHLKMKAHRLQLPGNIDWLGYVNNVEKYKIYLQSKVFVHPTIYDNNGMVAAEALCSGLPVVMYDLEPLRNVYKDGCIKIKFGDKLAYANVLASLIADDTFYDINKPSAKMVKQLEAHWDWVNRARLFQTFLQERKD